MPNLNLAEARKKALESPNIGQRGPDKKTLIKKEARERAIEGMKEKYMADGVRHLPEIIEVHFSEAKKPRNRQEREYVLDRALGKEEEEKPQQHLHLHQA